MVKISDLEKELGIAEALGVEASEVRLRVDTRRYGKNVTLVDGFDPNVDVDALARDLKRLLGTGGTSRDGVIELQGDHREKVRRHLTHEGYKVGP